MEDATYKRMTSSHWVCNIAKNYSNCSEAANQVICKLSVYHRDYKLAH